jgi:hypothetical protein
MAHNVSISRLQLLYKPFVVLAGLPSMIIALISIFAISGLAYVTGTHHYGLLNINFAKDTVFIKFLLEHLTYWGVSTVLLYGAGVFMSVSSIRFIDVAGTLGVSRLPLIFLSLVRLIPAFESFAINSINMYFLFILHLCLASWSVVLMLNAYRIACNVKNSKAVASFFACLLVTEIITQTIIRLSL